MNMIKAIPFFTAFLVFSTCLVLAQDTSYFAFSRLDYYTDEGSGEISVFAPESKKDMRITVDLAFEFDFLIRQHIAFPGHHFPVRFSLARFHEGNNEVTVSFYENEKWIDSRKVNVVVKKSVPGEVKADRLTGTLVVDGLPFIPVGFYCSWPLEPSFPEQEVVRGFNLLSPYWKIDKKSRKERIRFMDRCAELGMKVNYNLCSVAGGGGNTTSRSDGMSREEKMDLLRDEVELLKDHPALLAWYIADEPVGQGMPADSLKPAYDLIKELDPYHPISVVFMAPHMAGSYREVMDIAMTDPYPVPHGPILDAENYVKDLQDLFRYDKPVWLVPQAFGGNEWWTREPTAGEVRAMTYLGLVKGAAGIQYFIRKGPNATPKSQATWGECGAMAQELIALTPALTSGQPAPEIFPSSREIRAKVYNQFGMFTVLVVNVSPEPQEFSLKMDEIDLTMQGEVMFEGRRINIEEGIILDIIDGHGTRIYRFDNRQKTNRVKDFHPKNIAVDPGFEDHSIPAVPASCYVNPGRDPGATFFLDGREYQQGDHSIRLVTPTTGGGVSLSFFGLELDPERSYTCSVWAKASYNNLPEEKRRAYASKEMENTFVLGLGKLGGEEEKGRRGAVERFVLSGEWQQYSFTTAGRNIQPSLARWYSPQLKLDGRGTAWFDVLEVVPDLEIKNSRGEGEKGRRIALVSNHPDTKLYYTLDGSEPGPTSMEYLLPFDLENSSTLRAASYKEGQLNGTIRSEFVIHKATCAVVNYHKSYEKYMASGDEGLVDGIRGTTYYKDGCWQGFHGQNAEFTINLLKPVEISSISLAFLQDLSVWIFLPHRVTVSISRDGINFDKVIIMSPDIPLNQRGALIKEFKAEFDKTEVRYIKVEALNIGTCPVWHSGSGEPAWIFLDEIVVE